MEPRNASAQTRLSWRFENARSGEADVYIDDVIGDPWMGTSGADFAKELRDLKDVAKLNLHINSPGGLVKDGLQMYNAIRSHGAYVTALIESEAASAASFVAMAADKVVIFKNAKLFIHDAHGFGLGNAADFRTLADLLDEESDNIASIYADKAGGSVDEWRTAMTANDGVGSTYRGQAAVDAGLADEVATTPARNAQPFRVAAQAPSPPPAPEDNSREIAEALFEAMKGAVLEKPQPTLESLLGKHSLKEAVSAAATGGQHA